MKCPINTEQAFAFLDEQLGVPEQQVFSTHLRQCVACSQQLQEAQRARECWQEARAEELDEFTWSRLDKLLEQQIEEDARSRTFMLPFRLRFDGFARRAAWATIGAACALTLYMMIGLDTEPVDPAASPSEIVRTQEPKVGDVLSTGTESRTVWIAAAELTMKPAAVCRVATRHERTTKIELVSGRITFNVDRRPPGSVFQVQAGTVTVTVKGTLFHVERTSDGTVHVEVEHGLVAVQQSNEPATLLHAGERIARTERPGDRVATTVPPAKTTVDETLEPKATDPAAPKADDALVAETTQHEDRNTRSEPFAPRTRLQKKQTHKAPTIRKKARRPHPVDDTNTKQTPDKRNNTPNTDGPKPAPIRVIEINVDDPNVTYVDGDADNSAEKVALKSIVRAVGTEPYGTTIQRLRKWLRVHPSHRLQTTARYAIGYCEFKRGRLDTARRIFARLPKDNRWIRTIQDFDTPPKPY